MADYVDLWDNYSVEFCKKLEYDAGEDWNKLDQDEQEIAAEWKLLVDIYNGGFLQFFCNWGYDCYWYAMRGLKRMGNDSLLNLLHNTYNNVFDKFKEDSRLEAYWDIPKYLSEEDDKILSETDNVFYEVEGEKFAKMAYEFYCIGMNKKRLSL
ncbi:MAG: hypothetical protein BWY74_03091 [Firmicutes bacterium ADurb.Bin419]|nr:MAG: hypothetical protein BWY74_03091 [Firmicutes bacterium ADurb.Bin419]